MGPACKAGTAGRRQAWPHEDTDDKEPQPAAKLAQQGLRNEYNPSAELQPWQLAMRRRSSCTQDAASNTVAVTTRALQGTSSGSGYGNEMLVAAAWGGAVIGIRAGNFRGWDSRIYRVTSLANLTRGKQLQNCGTDCAADGFVRG